MKTYLLSMSDHHKVKRISISVASVAVCIFIISLLLIEDLNRAEKLPVFIGLLFGLVIGVPILLMIILKLVNAEIEVQINSEGIDTIKLGLIRFEDIKEIQLPINHNGYNTLLILKLKNGKKISFTPTVRVRSSADSNYQEFVKEFKNKMNMG